jgi:hypothetical protein
VQFVQTNLAEQMHTKIIDSSGGYLKMEEIVNGTSLLSLLRCN